MEESQISRSIPEEILVEILCQLPLESLHRLKWVSKSWRSLITREIFPKTLRPQFIGFLYNHLRGPFHYVNTTSGDGDDGNTAIDPNLSFLPLDRHGLLMLDCCNGLVLSRYAIGGNAPTYVVCNPFTKSWTRLPLTDDVAYCHMLIDFDPSISPHYKVVAFWNHRNRVFIKVYRSETGRWEQKRRTNLGDRISIYWCCRALWDGDLYVHAYLSVGTLLDGSFRGGHQTVRFGLSGGDDDFELIKFPMGTEMPHCKMHVARSWDGKLRFTDLDGAGLRVWTLRGEREKEWVLEHESTVRGLMSGRCLGLPPVVVGFHPAREAILIRSKHVVFAYHLQEMSLVEFLRMGKDVEVFVDVSLFPFLPCSYDFLESRINA